jgi:hypothetical protein
MIDVMTSDAPQQRRTAIELDPDAKYNVSIVCPRLIFQVTPGR